LYIIINKSKGLINIFTLKLKRKNKTERVSQVELKLKDNLKIVNTEQSMKDILNKYEIEDIKVNIDGKFYPIWNLYFKDFTQSFIVEGVGKDDKLD